MNSADSKRVRVGVALVTAVGAISLAAPLIYAARPAPALTVAALRIALVAVILCLVAGGELRQWFSLNSRQKLLVMSSGALLAAHFGVWIASLYLTSTAASVALVATQPVFAAILGRVFLGDTLRTQEGAGILIAAMGCVLLASGDASDSGALLGDMLAVFGAFFAAGYLVVGRQLRNALPLTAYLAMVNVVAAVLLLTVALTRGAPLVGFDSGVYLAIAACAIVPSIIGHTLLNWSVRRIATHLVALAILGEPVGASLIQWAMHGERPPLHAVAGGLVILFGIGFAFARGARSND